jgi:hypothetical protein
MDACRHGLSYVNDEQRRMAEKDTIPSTGNLLSTLILLTSA